MTGAAGEGDGYFAGVEVGVGSDPNKKLNHPSARTRGGDTAAAHVTDRATIAERGGHMAAPLRTQYAGSKALARLGPLASGLHLDLDEHPGFEVTGNVAGELVFARLGEGPLQGFGGTGVDGLRLGLVTGRLERNVDFGR